MLKASLEFIRKPCLKLLFYVDYSSYLLNIECFAEIATNLAMQSCLNGAYCSNHAAV